MEPLLPATDKNQPLRAGVGVSTVSDFSPLRRCVDNLLLDHGMRDVSMIVEDLADPAHRVTAGSKEMLISAVSDMTQRSRAIRLVASDKDWSHTLSQMTPSAQRESPAVLPPLPRYALRGSISVLDNPAARADAARPASPTSPTSPTSSTLGLELTLLSTQDMSVVPGTATRNAVTVFERSPGGESRAELQKFGTRFSVPAGAGQAEALRALVELSAIELFGRLAKVPYWTCFGASSADEAVATEIQDWYDTMAARPTEIIGYFQSQLRVRGVYEGPIDGVVNSQLKDAVLRYREVLGLSREPKLSLDFFKAYLSADHRALAVRLPPVATAAAVAAAAAPPAVVSAAAAPVATSTTSSAAPLAMRIAAGNEAHQFARGEAVQLTVRPNRDAHVYCYLQDENRKIIRFFPNRFQRDSRVQTALGLQLPGAMRFEIVMNPRGVQETVSCFATERDVLPQLPQSVIAGDFDPLPVTTLEQLRSAFVKVAGSAFAQESFEIRPK